MNKSDGDFDVEEADTSHGVDDKGCPAETSYGDYWSAEDNDNEDSYVTGQCDGQHVNKVDGDGGGVGDDDGDDDGGDSDGDDGGVSDDGDGGGDDDGDDDGGDGVDGDGDDGAVSDDGGGDGDGDDDDDDDGDEDGDVDDDDYDGSLGQYDVEEGGDRDEYSDCDGDRYSSDLDLDADGYLDDDDDDDDDEAALADHHQHHHHNHLSAGDDGDYGSDSRSSAGDRTGDHPDRRSTPAPDDVNTDHPTDDDEEDHDDDVIADPDRLATDNGDAAPPADDVRCPPDEIRPADSRAESSAHDKVTSGDSDLDSLSDDDASRQRLLPRGLLGGFGGRRRGRRRRPPRRGRPARFTRPRNQVPDWCDAQYLKGCPGVIKYLEMLVVVGALVSIAFSKCQPDTHIKEFTMAIIGYLFLNTAGIYCLMLAKGPMKCPQQCNCMLLHIIFCLMLMMIAGGIVVMMAIYLCDLARKATIALAGVAALLYFSDSILAFMMFREYRRLKAAGQWPPKPGPRKMKKGQLLPHTVGEIGLGKRYDPRPEVNW